MDTQLKIGPVMLVFHRTCRVPESSAIGKPNRLPASLGRFPLLKASELGEKRPKEFHPESYLIPIWLREALWIGIESDTPIALTVGAGKINAVTGATLESRLLNNETHPQNYLVCPPQPWLDGFKTADGTVRQFVAVQLGSGETMEGQLTGAEEVGGLQFGVHMPKIDLIAIRPPREYPLFDGFMPRPGVLSFSASPQRMGLGAGGQISQKIYPDPYVECTGKRTDEIWFEEMAYKAFVHLVSAKDWEALTGQKPPESPVTYEAYQGAGLPWFKLYDEDFDDIASSEKLAKVTSVSGAPSAFFKEKVGENPNPDTNNLW